MKKISLTAIVTASIILLMGVSFLYLKKKEIASPNNIACTQEAKQCPDGSYVGRTGKNCEFTDCPAIAPKTIPPTPQQPPSTPPPTPVPTPVPLPKPAPTPTPPPSGVSECTSDKDCPSSLVCHAGTCTEPITAQCSGPDDTSCSPGYRCIQSCGPPVARIGDPPPPYYCELEEVASKPRNCPICLASNTEVATPTGNHNVKDIKMGMLIWSLNKNGEKVASTVIKISHTPVPRTHRVIHLTLSDKREVWVSPNHPTVDGRTIQELQKGDLYDRSYVQSTELIPYWDTNTYDILSDSDTGYYWANGILLGSTLKK